MTPRISPVRLGIVGCGNVLGAYRMAVDRLRGAACVTVACGRETQRARACAELGIDRFVTDAAAVIEASDVDLVVILTSMASHAELASAALRAGKHVLVEKPLATTLAEGRALMELAARAPGHLVCAPFTTLSPTFRILAQRIRAGDIGQPCSARARYGWSGPWWSEWFYKGSGGCLFDLGVYCFTTLTGLLGPVRRVTAMTSVCVPERQIEGRPTRVEIEDNAQVLLDFGGGLLAVVTTGFTMQQYRCPAVEVYGSTGVVQMLGDDWDPEGYELWQNSVGAWQCYKETQPDWSWTAGLDHLVECIRTGTQPRLGVDHALHVLEIMLQARESAACGRVCELATSFDPLDVGEIAAGEPAHLAHDRSREH